MILKQQTRVLQLHSPQISGSVVLTAFSGQEALSQPFRFELQLLSQDPGQPDPRFVGSKLTFSIELSDQKRRYFDGYVNELIATGVADELYSYRAVVVPWLWFLGETADCRIFQNQSVPEILSQVFGELGYRDFDTSRLRGEYEKHEYCVQYRETDLNFVSRLLEQEGIFYYFEHEQGKHTLVLSDDPGGYRDCGQRTVDFPADRGSDPIVDHITQWQHRYKFRAGEWSHSDYNFLAPMLDLNAQATSSRGTGQPGKHEIYDYPGLYRTAEQGRVAARRRIEAEEVEQDLVTGASTCSSFLAGGRFTIGQHPHEVENGRSYVITGLRHRAVERLAYETSAAAQGPAYENAFTCIPANAVFRPPRVTSKPLISGTQTAIVVGPPNEEIWCDEFGRIKVQFHWDRQGVNDDASSCWIRVSQSVAGRKWGFMTIPRVGQEVVIDFLEGNPDQPLVVGSVYNAQQLPHYLLPQEKTRTYIKTNSSQGGEGFNELMFDDKAGSELVYLHAQRDLHLDALHDGRTRIGGDDHRIIGGAENEQAGSELLLVHRDRHALVKRHQVEQVAGNLRLTVGEGEAAGGGNVDLVVGGKRTELTRKDFDQHVEGNHRTQVDGTVHQSVAGDWQQRVGGNLALEAGSHGEIHLKAGTKVVIETGVQLCLKGPGGFINIGPEGVTVQGNIVRINSGGSPLSGRGANPELPAAAQIAKPVSPGVPFQSQSGLASAVDRRPPSRQA